ncbi:MAG: ribosome biogenesis GTP-binding protein YihA/YsxC [Bacteroidales bacterium]|jgi:GTP-binding protein|nr:ribosome biogenesis GTP-binding protein YihA/YsxC [Bacteroidales bacterium]
MIIHSASFIKSSPLSADFLKSSKPEFAFIGRSNVGKSSLINMFTGHKNLAKTSGQPGKTKMVNYFLVNDTWHLVDLPGYGYAKTSQRQREKWMVTTTDYILKTGNLACLFVIIDSRIAPQESDLRFMEFLGNNQIPFARIFTKSDKVSAIAATKTIAACNSIMLETWESLPATFLCSSKTGKGKDAVLLFIEKTICNFSKTDYKNVNQ